MTADAYRERLSKQTRISEGYREPAPPALVALESVTPTVTKAQPQTREEWERWFWSQQAVPGETDLERMRR